MDVTSLVDSSARKYRMRPGTLIARKAMGDIGAMLIDEKGLEDLYCNRLWKKQLPKDRSWETIYEDPIWVAKSGSMKVQSVARQKRLLKFLDNVPAIKLKWRLQRARKRGWRPMGKQQLLVAESVLQDKLAKLETELAPNDS